MTKNLPAPVEGADEIAKLGLGIGAAVAALINPWLGAVAGVGQTALGLAIDRCKERPQAILLAELRAGNLGVLTNEQQAASVPMAFRFFEAARQGEYEHNLEVLAAYITGELKKEIPDPGDVGRVARRIECLSQRELKVLALVSDFSSKPMLYPSYGPGYEGVCASTLCNEYPEASKIGHLKISECLAELANRALLLRNGASGFDKAEDHYFTTQAFRDLIDNAKTKFERTASDRPAE